MVHFLLSVKWVPVCDIQFVNTPQFRMNIFSPITFVKKSKPPKGVLFCFKTLIKLIFLVKIPGLAQIDSKMVEDIFKGVLSPHPSSTSPAADQAGTQFSLPPIPPVSIPSGPRPQPPTTLAPFSIPPPQGFHGGDFR